MSCCNSTGLRSQNCFCCETAILRLDFCCAQISSSIVNHVFVLQAIGDVVIGSVLGPSSQRANECRIAMFLAGYPETVPVRTVNRYNSFVVELHYFAADSKWISCAQHCCISLDSAAVDLQWRCNAHLAYDCCPTISWDRIASGHVTLPAANNRPPFSSCSSLAR